MTLGELDAALAARGPFESRPFLAVAVSGGPDSLALTLLADRWARARGGAICALSVDHRLRPQSSAEIARLGGWLARRAIRHEILVWDGARPTSGIQAAARAARYRLLAAWCRRAGCLHLLTAHQREDQAETHLIRAGAGSGADGLAAMSAVRELDGCRLLRPLLGVPKARLVALLAAEGQEFLLDPSNGNPDFARARLRAADGERSTIAGIETLLARIEGLGRERRAREDEGAALLAGLLALHPAGFAALDRQLLVSAPASLAERLLGRVVASLGVSPHPLRRTRVARLRRELVEAPSRARTLGGCRLVPWRGRVMVLRELARAAAPVSLSPGACLFWDRRFVVRREPGGERSLVLGYLGAAQTACDLPGGEASGIPRLVHSVLPAFWDEEGLLCVPHLRYRRAGAGAVPALSFRPDFPVTRAGFTVV